MSSFTIFGQLLSFVDGLPEGMYLLYLNVPELHHWSIKACVVVTPASYGHSKADGLLTSTPARDGCQGPWCNLTIAAVLLPILSRISFARRPAIRRMTRLLSRKICVHLCQGWDRAYPPSHLGPS